MGNESSLDLLRRGSNIRIDGEGRWCHEGDPIRNERVAELFDRSFRIDGAGEVRLELGDEWCYVEIDDTAYFVRRVRDLDGGGVMLVLNDGTEELLDPGSLHWGQPPSLYCRVKSERYPARLLRSAYHHVLHKLDMDDEGRIVWKGEDSASGG